MATTVADERAAIETTVELSIDGASNGDAAKLELTANSLDSDGGYGGRIVGVEQTGDGAVVTVEESGCWYLAHTTPSSSRYSNTVAALASPASAISATRNTRPSGRNRLSWHAAILAHG